MVRSDLYAIFKLLIKINQKLYCLQCPLSQMSYQRQNQEIPQTQEVPSTPVNYMPLPYGQLPPTQYPRCHQQLQPQSCHQQQLRQQQMYQQLLEQIKIYQQMQAQQQMFNEQLRGSSHTNFPANQLKEQQLQDQQAEKQQLPNEQAKKQQLPNQQVKEQQMLAEKAKKPMVRDQQKKRTKITQKRRKRSTGKGADERAADARRKFKATTNVGTKPTWPTFTEQSIKGSSATTATVL